MLKTYYKFKRSFPVSVGGKAVFIGVVLLVFLQGALAQSFTEVVSVDSSLVVEEKEEVYTSQPKVRVDPEGGFIVADSKESQVRIYKQSGDLKQHFGHKGQGPGGLRTPSASVRLASGSILVPELNGDVSLFRESGSFAEEYSRVLVPGTNRVHRIPGENSVLLVGTETNTPGAHPLLHKFAPEDGSITESFFPHPIPLGEYGGYLFGVGQIAAADVNRDQIAVAFAPIPRLYFFSLEGSLDRKVELSFSHFREVEKPGGEVSSRQEFFKIAERHSRISDVFWLDEDVLLIQYYDFESIKGRAVRWNLAVVASDGSVLAEMTDTPQLYAVKPETGGLIFDDPDHVAPNHWVLGHLKRGVTAVDAGQ